MKRLTLLVTGNVQKAGYRDRIVEIGKSLGLVGFAENLPDGGVRIIAEGEEEMLEHLAEAANIKNTLIHVDDIKKSYGEASFDFSDFSKMVKGGETDERLDIAANLMKELIAAVNRGFEKSNNTMVSGFNTLAHGQTKMLEKQDKMLEKQDKMLEKQDKMLEKQDSQLKITEQGFNDIKQEMRKGFAGVKEEIHMQRDDFKEVFMHEVSELRGEIADIRATLARMQEPAAT